MKVNEFIKKYGIAEAKALVNAKSWTMRQIALSTTVDTRELTKLVESHELVMEFGDDASYLKEHLLRNPTIKEFYLDDWCRTFSVVRLKQAILDVESCQ